MISAGLPELVGDWSAGLSRKVAGLAPGQLTEGAGASYGSVRDTLVHTMSAQWIWLQRWKGVSPRAMLSAGDFPDLGAIRTHWAALERETREFVEGLDEAQLAVLAKIAQPVRFNEQELILEAKQPTRPARQTTRTRGISGSKPGQGSGFRQRENSSFAGRVRSSNPTTALPSLAGWL